MRSTARCRYPTSHFRRTGAGEKKTIEDGCPRAPDELLLSELKRRNVYKVAVAYAVVGWLLVQIATQTFPFFEVPNWAVRLVILLVVLGFPVALIIAWAFELTPQGLKRTESDANADVAPRKQAGGKAWIYVVIAGVALSAGLFFLGRYTARRTAGNEDGPRSAASLPDKSAVEKSVAVLPFENRSRDPDNAYFADGIQDEILTRLAKIAELKVISRTSTQKYKGGSTNLREIAQQLDVAHIVEGSVQKSGDQVRVTVQLIRAANDSHLWAETYDRKLTDIFAIESEIAEAIARALRAKLTPHEQQAVTTKPTENAEAYESYLRGLALWNTLSVQPGDFDKMVKYFSRAVELDPKFAIAWSFLSVTHAYRYHEMERTPERAAQAKAALDQAVSLQPQLGETQFAEGMYQYKVRRDFDKALEAFQKARQSSTNRPMAIEFMSYVKRRQGKWDEALALHTESLELDPRNPILLSEAAVTYRCLRRFDEAHALIDRAREIEPGSPQLLVMKAEVALAQGDTATAGRLLKSVVVPDGGDPNVALASVRFWMLQRQYPEAIAALQRVMATAQTLPAAFLVNYRAELAILEAQAGFPGAKEKLERSSAELKAIRGQGGNLNWTDSMLLLVSALLKDKATVDTLAAQFREKIESDALVGPSLKETIAQARAQLGETEAALKIIKGLLETTGEGSLTPALLRMDPFWDPIRNDPRFKEMAGEK